MPIRPHVNHPLKKSTLVDVIKSKEHLIALHDAAHFEEMNLSNSSFESANLYGSNFEGAVLIGTRFQGADLRSARFDNAFLERAYFERAVLAGISVGGAKLAGAHFEGACLCNVDLRTGLGLQDSQLAEAFRDECTIVPAKNAHASLRRCPGRPVCPAVGWRPPDLA
jgi:uncharacterized protein YjbI with pentapeptide repeats